jgi:hypothetical protein
MVFTLFVEYAFREQQIRIVQLLIVSKLNTAGIMKAISDISPQNYSQLLMNSNNNQLAIDEFLKVISIELNEAKM